MVYWTMGIRQWHVKNALIFERYLGVHSSKTPVNGQLETVEIETEISILSTITPISIQISIQYFSALACIQ